METVKYRLEGISPSIQHNGQVADPLNPYKKRIAEFSKLRNRTEEQEMMMRRLEWESGLYLHPETGRVYWPADNIFALVWQGGKRFKLGEHIKRAVFEAKAGFELEYDGPSDVDGLWKDKRFVDMRPVRLGSGGKKTTVMRTRPIFKEWSLVIEFYVDTEELDIADLGRAVEAAGMYVGLSDYRPRYGRFTSRML